MNTPIIFPFQSCDGSDIKNIQDYTAYVEQGYNDINEYFIPNPPIQTTTKTIANTSFNSAEWEIKGDHLIPVSGFGGDTFTYNLELIPNRLYFAHLNIEITSGGYDFNIGGSSQSITSQTEYTNILGNGADLNIEINFSSAFEGKFFGFTVYMLDTVSYEVSNDGCGSFTPVTQTNRRDSVLIKPFATQQTSNETYIISETRLSSNNLGPVIRAVIPDAGNNYTVSNANVIEDIDQIDFILDGVATTVLTIPEGMYRLKFTGIFDDFKVELGALVIGEFQQDPNAKNTYTIDFLSNGIAKLEFWGREGGIINNIRLYEHLPMYSIKYFVAPVLDSVCGGELENLLHLRWRHNSNVGLVPFCDNPYYFNEIYLKGVVNNALPEDEAFEGYVDGCNNMKVAYSNQYNIFDFNLSDMFTPIQMFNAICLAAKHSEFYVNDVKYSTVIPLGETDLSEDKASVIAPVFKLVSDNGNEINNCDC